MGASISKITDDVYLGNLTGAQTLETLQEYNITHIICLHDSPFFPDKFQYLEIFAFDIPDFLLLDHFEKTYDFIENAIKSNGKVFIHCAAGVSRSPTIVIAYFMKKNNWDYQEAHDFVNERRRISPNEGFQYQLQLWKKLDYQLEGKSESHKIYKKMKSINLANEFINTKAAFWNEVKKNTITENQIWDSISQLISILNPEYLFFEEKEFNSIQKMIEEKDSRIKSLFLELYNGVFEQSFYVEGYMEIESTLFLHFIKPLQKLFKPEKDNQEK
ncbi:protein phosphatase slingshot [Anaeramoeba ignava]|uniref:protein-tyrosine-phosphatase n=1 Tax=Anaeramoeba ignava TaxID=1746090 RepID=A0A9Q0LD24_ANAIG|nr:protein phosphatase slingshot [Anaeramoeba ignava]